MGKKIVKFNDGVVTIEKNEADMAFIEKKIKELLIHSNYINKEYHMNLFQEILDMCDNDITTADFSDVTTKVPYFNLDKENFIISYNIIYILGTIYLNVFNKPGNRLVNIEDGINGPISTQQMFAIAYQELEIKVKEVSSANNICAYGATLIFATIFEHDLKGRVKQIEVKKLLSLLKSKKDTAKINLDENDEKLFDYLYNEYFNGTTLLGYDGVSANTVEMYALLTKYSIINNNDKNLEKLIKNELTLGGLLNSSIFENIVDDKFIQMCKLIFGTRKMNLRNNLAHCNFGYLNYYHINVTVLLYIFCFMVSDEMFLK